jgi:hypothetical protein
LLRVHQVLSQGGVNGARVLLGFENCLIDPDELFPAPRFLAEAIVGDAVKPGRKLRFTAEAPDVFEGFEEGFLAEVIGERGITARELTEQTADRRLMPAHELRERVVVIIEKDSGDEVCIRQ